MADSNNNKYKVLLLGNDDVGKTTFFKTATATADQNTYNNNMFKSTIGIDFDLIKVPIKDETIILQIYDTAGNRSFRHITTSYIRGSDTILLFFDITNEYSYESIRSYWLSKIVENGTPKVIYIIGTKIDKLRQRKVSLTDILKWTDEIGIRYFEISTYSGFNIGTILVQLSTDLITPLPNNSIENNKMEKITTWIDKHELSSFSTIDLDDKNYVNYNNKCFFCF